MSLRKQLGHTVSYVKQGSLTLGMSLTLGLLSFGGMIAFLVEMAAVFGGLFLLIPVLPVAIVSLVLALVYEIQIFGENIRGAEAQSKKNYVNNRLAREYLLSYFEMDPSWLPKPQFFKDYETKLLELHDYQHKSLDKDSKKRKLAIEKTLKDMEHVLAQALFSKKEKPTDYFKKLADWLDTYGDAQTWRVKLENRQYYLGWRLKTFAWVAGIFTGLGMTYTLAELFVASTFLAGLPFVTWVLLIPICIVASVKVTEFSIAKFINNGTVKKWYVKLRNAWEDDGFSWRLAGKTLGVLILLALALALTLCTAGTWLTVASQGSSIFGWVTSLPKFIMQIINPLMTMTSAGFFNIQNIAETVDALEEADNPWETFKENWHAFWKNLQGTENSWQRWNLPRLLLKVTLLPLRILFFLGHLLSISVSTDKVPGISEIIAVIIAFINEGFEDGHFFFEKEDERLHTLNALLIEHFGIYAGEGHSHNHDGDLPTLLLKYVAFGWLYVLAAAWDCAFSQLNATNGSGKKVLGFTAALKKQCGIAEDEAVVEHRATLSAGWEKEHTEYRLEKFRKNHFNGLFYGRDASPKIQEFETVQNKIHEAKGDSWKPMLVAAKDEPVFSVHRLGIFGKPSSYEFLEALPALTCNPSMGG